jgi:hypothetical protein
MNSPILIGKDPDTKGESGRLQSLDARVSPYRAAQRLASTELMTVIRDMKATMRFAVLRLSHDSPISIFRISEPVTFFV